MSRVYVPDDAPAVLRPSAVWPGLAARAQVEYHDTLPGSEDGLIERIAAAELVLNVRSSSKFSERVFRACPKLRLVSVWGTGTDHVDLVAAAHYGVTITNTPEVSAVSIAEHTLALLLAVARRIPQIDAETRTGAWPCGRSVELAGKTCGIIGLGAIGMRVIAWTMHPRELPGVEIVELDELYRTSDVISVHLRLWDQTTGMIGRREFAMMKKTAILVNTARGAIVDEASMLHALTQGIIAGAGLDVFAVEPLPSGHPIAGLPNVVITPHCAGVTPEALEAGLRLSVENIWSFLDGRRENAI